LTQEHFCPISEKAHYMTLTHADPHKQQSFSCIFLFVCKPFVSMSPVN